MIDDHPPTVGRWIGVRPPDGRVRWVLGPDRPTPAAERRVVRTGSDARRGTDDVVVRLDVVDDGSDPPGTLLTVTLPARAVRRDVPAGSEVEVGVYVDGGGVVRVEAYVPAVDEDVVATAPLPIVERGRTGGNGVGPADPMRSAGRVAGNALAAVGDLVRPGVTGREIDQLAHDMVRAEGARPSLLGYRGFPYSSTVAVNDGVCNAVPGGGPLLDGDIVTVAVAACVDGAHAKCSATFGVGEVAERDRLLMERSEQALARAVRAALPGREVNVLGRVVESYARRFGYGVVREFTGHGIGRELHTGLVVPAYEDRHHATVIEPGMTFTIQPMLTLGGVECDVDDDGWTVRTRDRSRAAEFHDTIRITDDGPEVLTAGRTGGGGCVR